MENEGKITGQPVALDFFSQNSYANEPVRQIEYAVLYIEKGKGSIFFGNSEFPVHSGDFIFINSFEEHYFRQDTTAGVFRCYRILFDISALGAPDDPSRMFFEEIRLCRFLNMPEELGRRFSSTASLQKDFWGRGIILRSILLDVISFAVETGQYERFSQLPGTEKRSLSAIEYALRYIRTNYSENLSLGTILQLTNYSKSHFIRLFKESTGMNVSEYINKYRIEKACLDLIYTNNNITEIATASGFNNIQYFSRKFKEYMECTPKQYQKKRKKLTSRG